MNENPDWAVVPKELTDDMWVAAKSKGTFDTQYQSAISSRPKGLEDLVVASISITVLSTLVSTYSERGESSIPIEQIRKIIEELAKNADN